jgi:hypothetical protein
MINLRHLAVGAALLLTLSSCGDSEDATSVSVVEAGNPLLAYVPADSPYLLGNLAPISDEIIDTYLTRAQPALDAIQDEVSRSLASMEDDSGSDATDDDSDVQATRLMQAVLQELDGKFNRAGLQSLGFDLQSYQVVYGMGMFPVVRLGLTDAGALRATIQRVLGKAGIDATERDIQGVKYWRLADDATPDATAGLYVAILSDHLAVSLFPPLAEDELLPAFLGLSRPADSDAAARLERLNADNDYTPFGSGILDLNLLLDAFTRPDTAFARTLAARSDTSVTDLPPECLSELRQIVSYAPRLTFGTTELTTHAVGIQYRVETQPTLAQELAALVADIPLADPLSKKFVEFSFGMRLGALRDFLRDKMASIQANPFQCEHLQDLNDSAAEAFASLNQPLPPLINNFRGLRASLAKLSIDDYTNDTEGMAAIHVEKPLMFVNMGQMFVPDLENLALEPGQPPVRLPQSILPMPDVVAYAALTDDAIGLSIGEGQENDLPAYLSRKAGSDGTFLSANYDLSAYLDLTRNLTDQIESMQQDMDPGEPDVDVDVDVEVHVHSFRNIGDAAQNAFREMADRSYFTLRFTPDGFQADSRMTFK